MEIAWHSFYLLFSPVDDKGQCIKLFSFPIFAVPHFSISFPSISNFIILHSFSCILFCIQGSFLAKPLPLKPLLSITINHLAFKDKGESCTLRVTQDQAVGAWEDFQRCVLCNPSRSRAKSMAVVVVLSVCQRRGCCWYEKRQLGPQVDIKLLLANKRINTSRMEY